MLFCIRSTFGSFVDFFGCCATLANDSLVVGVCALPSDTFDSFLDFPGCCALSSHPTIYLTMTVSWIFLVVAHPSHPMIHLTMTVSWIFLVAVRPSQLTIRLTIHHLMERCILPLVFDQRFVLTRNQ